MQLIRSIKKMQTLARELTASGKSIGLVPTMGSLHQGHLSLIDRAKRKTDSVITTIFVNPAQFGRGEDLKNYPLDEKGDLAKIKSIGGQIVFLPRADDIYSDDFQTWVNVENLTNTLEGKARPAHFRGVTTIVAKLFNITRPDLVVFGQKDYQQAVVLKRMTLDLGYPIKFVIAPTVRERDGLAMSSRNRNFSPDQRPEAICLYLALRTAREMIKSRIDNVKTISNEMRAVIRATCAKSKVDYIAFTEFESLKPVRKAKRGVIVSVAASVHGVRLIDNMKL
ncbi:MAG: pantoate--beta-alanine ligase [candidate division Zixibacteria bacterium]